MIDALVAGERDPVVLADLAKKRLRSKIPELRRALVGRFGEHHAAMLRLHLAHTITSTPCLLISTRRSTPRSNLSLRGCAGCRPSPG